MTKSIPWLLAVLILLVSANLGLTAYVAFRTPVAPAPAEKAVGDSVISERDASQLEAAFVNLYNAKDSKAMYASMDKFAQVQIAEPKLADQLEKLHALLGQVSNSVYTHAELAGTSDGKTFYTLYYKVSLTGQIPNGSLKLTVIKNGDRLGLVGFYLTGSDTTAN